MGWAKRLLSASRDGRARAVPHHNPRWTRNNAMPLGLGRAIGKMLRKAVRRKADKKKLGGVHCGDTMLIERFLARPRTIMNPQRMRKVKGVDAARKWLGKRTGARTAILKYIE